MRLVEVIVGKHTRSADVARVVALARRLSKVPVVAKNAFGFIGNYMAFAREAAVERLIAEAGVTPARIDAALEAYGFRLGPCATADLSGLDIGAYIRREAGMPPSPTTAPLVARGWLGRKTGRGYYRYDEAGRRHRDEEVEALIVRTSPATSTASTAAAPASDADIVRELNEALHAAGTTLLQAGVAASASDIDVVWVHGFGFPPYRGGPMHAVESERAKL